MPVYIYSQVGFQYRYQYQYQNHTSISVKSSINVSTNIHTVSIQVSNSPSTNSININSRGQTFMRAAGDTAAADVDAFFHFRHHPLRAALRVSIS